MDDLKLWLAYVSYPVTTAAYLERALRKICRTVTIGPTLPAELVQRWQLENMKLPIREQDIPTTLTPDMRQILADTDESLHPDLYLWVESVAGHYPQNLDAVKCPKVCYLIDSHLNLKLHLEWAKNFDFVFIVHRQYLADFKKIHRNVHWLPVGCDPDVHAGHGEEKRHEIGYVGGIMPASRRERLLRKIGDELPLYCERSFWDEMARTFARSKMVFNSAVKNDLNMRVFEAMSTGTLLLTDHTRDSGQDVLFVDGEDYALYSDHDVCDTARFYLQNPQLAERIAARGRQLVHNAHTYAHRVEDLLDVVVRGKPATFSAEELRERSVRGVADNYPQLRSAVSVSRESRSFVIPVLDHSPASEYNIVSLLQDLERIDGDVIVVFNSAAMAEQLKGHPRIGSSAIMNKNVGVARAWNIGLNIAVTPTVFIVNADVHLGREAVEELENGLRTLDGAACVGPQGSFYDFRLTRDLAYFDKGSFSRPMEVDAVSGFLFAVRREHFDDKLLKFENDYTPCYFEEWDLGLQIKRAGLKNWIVPATAYDHHWSGSIRALREIAYYDRAETAQEILARNRLLFLAKWRAITGREGIAHILESGAKRHGIDCGKQLILEKKIAEADSLFAQLLQSSAADGELASLKRFTAVQLAKTTGRFAP